MAGMFAPAALGRKATYPSDPAISTVTFHDTDTPCLMTLAEDSCGATQRRQVYRARRNHATRRATHQPIRLPVPAYLVETDQQRILIDTGLYLAAAADATAFYGRSDAMDLFTLEQDPSVAEQVAACLTRHRLASLAACYLLIHGL